jgi:raffinose/stachyose/melibiose transport system permease protein
VVPFFTTTICCEYGGGGHMNKTLRNPLIYILFIVPTLILYIAFFILPVFQSLAFGFTKWNGISPTGEFVGLDNFIKAFKDKRFWISVRNNSYFILFSIFVQLPIIVIFSLLISNVKRFKGFYKTAVFIPSILSTAVIGILWGFIYEPNIGILNRFLGIFGAPKLLWLADPELAMFSILLTNAWQWTGFYIILVLAAILTIPKDLNEAAEIDGATGFQKATQITMPLIRPVINVVILLSIAGAMKAADIVIVMTRGGPFGSTDVMATYMINRSFQIFQYGYGAAIAILIFVFTLIVTLLFYLLTKTKERIEY